jgi:hypothetical protein
MLLRPCQSKNGESSETHQHNFPLVIEIINGEANSLESCTEGLRCRPQRLLFLHRFSASLYLSLPTSTL